MTNWSEVVLLFFVFAIMLFVSANQFIKDWNRSEDFTQSRVGNPGHIPLIIDGIPFWWLP